MDPCKASFHFLKCGKTKNENKLLLERLGNSENNKNTKNMNLLLETAWSYSTE